MKIFLIVYLILLIAGIIYGILEFKKTGFDKSSLLPLHILVWNAFWLPIYMVAVLLFSLIVLLYRGPTKAKEILHELT